MNALGHRVSGHGDMEELFGHVSAVSFQGGRNLSTTLRHSPLQFTVQDLLSLDWVG